MLVRVMGNILMVRVAGGWQELQSYIEKKEDEENRRKYNLRRTPEFTQKEYEAKLKRNCINIGESNALNFRFPFKHTK